MRLITLYGGAIVPRGEDPLRVRKGGGAVVSISYMQIHSSEVRTS